MAGNKARDQQLFASIALGTAAAAAAWYWRRMRMNNPNSMKRKREAVSGGGCSRGSAVMKQGDIVGFDLDHALGRYKLRPCFELIYKAVRLRLLQTIELELAAQISWDFCHKGIILDTTTGDLIKLAEDGRVLRARHGTQPPLTEEQCIAKYGDRWNRFEELLRTNRSDNYFLFLTYFEMPAAHIAAQLVDWCDEHGHTSFADKVVKPMLECFTYNFSFEAFEEERGTYFPAIRANPTRYIYELPHLASYLKEAAKQQTIVLVTNSHICYANLVLNTCLGAEWRRLFDLCVVLAGKPKFFFDKNRLFEKVENPPLPTPTCKVSTESIVCDEHTVYKQGSAAGALAALSRRRQAAGWKRWLPKGLQRWLLPEPNVVYVGDHIVGDVTAASMLGWKTVAVVEEAGSPSTVQPREHKGVEEYALPHREEWGGFFEDAIAGKSVRTYWAAVLDRHADAVIPSVCASTQF